jgi:hypothetical protein
MIVAAETECSKAGRVTIIPNVETQHLRALLVANIADYGNRTSERISKSENMMFFYEPLGSPLVPLENTRYA